MCGRLSNRGTWMDTEEQQLGDELFRCFFCFFSSMDFQPDKCKQNPS